MPEAQRFPQITAAAQVGGRGAVQQVAQQCDGAAQHLVEGGQARGVADAEAAHLLDRVRGGRACAERIAIGQRQEVLHRSLDHAQPVAGEPELGDHPGIEQAHGVAGGRVAEAWVELLGDGRTANDPPALEHGHAQPRPGEVTGTGQAVVTAADDQGVEICSRGLATG